jgi:hypothetical protein
MRRSFVLSLAAAGLAIGLSISTLEAQVTLNARAGIGVPTGDVADAAKTGFDLGGGLGVMLGERVELRANIDYSLHGGEEVSGVAGPDVDVLHLIGGIGVLLTNPDDPFYVSINAGAGALSFNIDAEGVDTETYFAINAGAEIGYWVLDNLAIFASPQGDIAFADEDVLGTDAAFVWPFTGGLKVRLGS